MLRGISDNPVYELCLAHHKTAALRAAVEMDVFTRIGRAGASAEALAAGTGSSPRGMRILCDFLCVIGLLEKNGGTYVLTPEAGRYLDRTSTQCLADVVGYYASEKMAMMVMRDPASYVMAGGNAGAGMESVGHPVWVQYARAMAPFASIAAKRAAAYLARKGMRPERVLDVAAGHGLFGLEAARISDTAALVAIDGEGVLAVARENAEKAGMASRFRVIVGDAFEADWDGAYDLILIPNFLHHFHRDACVRLLAKSKGHLAPGGAIFVIDIMPNPDRVSPPEKAAFAFFMLATTKEGDAYTAEEIERMARDAGLAVAGSMPLSPTPQTLLDLRH
ncbi:MAG: class I SAM-dependent methyltransferase [Planctomycetota bacterium]